MRKYIWLILFAFIVEDVFGDAAVVKSVKEGDCVTLTTNVTKQQHDNMMRWYFNDTLIALINGDPSTSCLYDGVGGMFRDRLKVDYETGSLNITNITTQHTGRYEAAIIRSESSGKSESLNRSPKCNRTNIINKSSNRGDIIQSINLTVNGSGLSPDVPDSCLSPAVPGSGLSPAVVAGICVVLLLTVGVGVMIFRRRSSSEDKKKIKHVLEKVSKDKMICDY
ncbi:uncharacterized protein LOC127987121 [Carassius gibelio]|uniref:uncharacterized protein LOC127987121 n=1 Tax=Carassius gibelio TaxID=101364 RepID=UPI00227907C5|nr:uncharacterized protein LOC127987121 [Carassius gibelio]